MISVIIPVYNVEKYLKRCIESVINQSCSDLEIILVDDGSVDSSLDICKEYAEKDFRIKVLHKENGGLSSARNAGLDIAHGELIAFVDSDDFIHKDMYKIMADAMNKTSADMVICGIEYVYENEEEKHNILSINTDIELITVKKPYILRQIAERNVVTTVQWNKLFKAKLLEGIRFPVGKLSEDEFVIHKQLYKCDVITYVEAELYFYLQRTGSIMHDRRKAFKQFDDKVTALQERVEFMQQAGLIEDRDIFIRQLLSTTYNHYKKAALKEGFSAYCRHIVEKFEELLRIYPEHKNDFKAYSRLLNNPYKYTRMLPFTEKIENIKCGIYPVYKKLFSK